MAQNRWVLATELPQRSSRCSQLQPPEVAGPLFEDDSLHRFLRARNGDVPKAEKMLLKTLEYVLEHSDCLF